MKEVKVVTLEDNIDYIVISKVNIDNNTYLFLANENDPKDLCIRKEITENNIEYLVGLENEDEFNKVMLEYNKKTDMNI